jgi:hypothetical protein
MNLKVPDLKPDWLSEGGIYVSFSNGSEVIFIKNSIVMQGQLRDVLTHELGHAVGATLSDQDWATFYKLRNIPAGTDRRGTNWNMSPQEDFAEVYKSVFTGLSVRTYYGVLVPEGGRMDLGNCSTAYMTAENKYRQQVQQSKAPATSTYPFMFQTMTPEETNAIADKANRDSAVQECRRKAMSDPSQDAANWRMFSPYVTSVDLSTRNFMATVVTK